MNGDDDVFADALSLPPAERSAFLAAACQEDSGQRARVEALLSGYDGAQKILKTPLAVRVAASPEEMPGDVIGRYKLVEKIGEGGMGIVYLAGQEEPVRRRVALKIIKLGMDTKAVVTRFEAERQALALMEHPNIARVFDGGATSAGRPYFVMELVRGVKITEYCDEARLSTRERLDLFIQVCQAIQHAHQKGIIHRDIKPSNILVTVNDGVAVPKVIDFGIAKALPHLQERLTDETIVTQFAALMGTPAYMSPEQALMTSVDIDTRSDIYSLGVLLYEILTGRTPFDPKELLAFGLDEVRRTIREKEPARPSTRLATLQREELTTTAKRRSSDSSRLLSQLKGDLDWIVMKCLEKDRARRYETASGLAADLKRHLYHETVLARPPSAAYWLRKTIRRNKLAFAAATAVAVTLMLGAAFSTWSYLRERKAHAGETVQRLRADAENLNAQRNLYAARMNLAQQAWDQNNLDRLRELLEETSAFPDRGFEWYYWQRQAHLPLMTLRGYLSHKANVWSVAFSPDGKRIVSGNGDNNARVWDAVSGRQLFRLEHRAQFNSVAFSPNGQWIVAGLGDGMIKLWDAASGEERLAFKAHAGGSINSVSFSPGSERIVSSGRDKAAKVWDTATGRALLTLTGHRGEVISAAFSPDGERIVTSSADESAKVWQTATGAELFRLEGHANAVVSVAWSRDGHRIVTGGMDGRAKIWDATSGREELALKGHGEPVVFVGFLPDGQKVVTGSVDRTIRIWNTADGRELHLLKGHGDQLNAVAVSPDGRRIVSGSKDQTVRVWDALTGSEPTTLKGHGHRIVSIAFSPDSERILTGSIDTTARMWAADTGQELFTLHGHAASLSSVAVSPDGQRFFTGSQDQTGRVWNATDGRLLFTLDGHVGAVWCGAYSPDGKRIVTGGAYGMCCIWDAITGRKLFTLSESNVGAILSAAFSPDGQRIITGNSNHSAKVWDATNGRELLKLNGHTGSIHSVAFSPDGRRIATGGRDGSAKVWDATTGRVLMTLKGHLDAIVAVAYSPDGARIATAGSDRSVRLWDATGGQELLTLTGHDATIGSVAFSPNGRLLVTGYHNGIATIRRAAGADQVAAWQAEDHAVALRLAKLARVRPGLMPFLDEATTAERYLAAFERTSPTEQELARATDEGAIKRWLVLAPIPLKIPVKGSALDQQPIAGAERMMPVAGQRTSWENGALTWQELSQEDYVIDFITLLGRVTTPSVAYAVCYVRTETPQSGLRLLVGSDSNVQLYLNGQLVHEHQSGHPFDADRDVVNGITLKAGLNIVTLKALLSYGNWRWRDSVRFTDANGDSVNGITVTLDPDSVK